MERIPSTESFSHASNFCFINFYIYEDGQPKELFFAVYSYD